MVIYPFLLSLIIESKQVKILKCAIHYPIFMYATIITFPYNSRNSNILLIVVSNNLRNISNYYILCLYTLLK